jgi:hypothetical protein
MTKRSPFEVGRLMMSLWVPQAIRAAAELGLADVLARGPASAADVSTRARTHPEATERLLDALLVLELVERHDGLYSLTELGGFLRDDAPASRRAWARLMGGERVWNAWGKLTDCVRTGEPAFARAGARTSDTETFDVLFDDDEAADIFHRAMADGTRSVARDLVAAIDFGSARSVVDVGGGWGALLASALEAHPDLRGSVFDLPHARRGAEQLFHEHGLAERARFTSGDLFREAPPRAERLLLKSVIHDWNDERSIAILERCRSALEDGGQIVIVEPPAPEDGVPDSFAWIVAFSDLNMLVNTGGRERTAAQYVGLVERAGLRVSDTRPAGFYTCFVCIRA